MSDVENPENLVHLHVHSEYSLLDGAIRISDAIQEAKSQGHTSLALTDHSNMFGAIEFYTKCKAADLNPIIGAEVNWDGVPQSQEIHKTSEGSDTAFHLVLLAKSTEGYKNLCRVVSSCYLRHDFSGTPRAPLHSLQANARDLIVLSSCLKGEFAYLCQQLVALSSDPIEELRSPQSVESEVVVGALNAHVAFMKETYGENYYVELIDNNLPSQRQMLPVLVAVAYHYDLPIVATADCHYLHRDDSEAHAVLTSVKNDLKQSQLVRRNKSAEFHMFSNQEMHAKYSQWPEALENQAKIAGQCQVELSFGTYFLPQFELAGSENVDDALRRLSQEGLEERLTLLRVQYGESFNDEVEKVYHRRLDYELGIIIKMGFPGYFLIVQDFINWAKNQDIPVGPGRGSGAGSLIAYALRITDLDPIKFNLIFERFLNPERISMPDFDVDFCQERRDEVIQYVSQKYGEDNVAQITTFGKMKAKAALRDVGRVLELGYTKVDRIAKLIPNELDITLKDALEREPRILEEAKKDELIEKMVDLALKLEGMSRHTSVHAAGVVISEGGMDNYVPVYKSEDGALITQYEMKNAEKVGLVKFDFLGLKTLTVIQKAVNLIRKEKDPNFDIERIDIESKPVYELVSSAASVGIFQLESSGMQALLSKLKPSRFEDIIAVVALFRPGPLGSGMVDDFIERKHGRQEIRYLHPDLEPILKDTYGIILYQEQVQKIAAALASYTLGEADLLRRAMGKKKPEEMAKQKARFMSGCKKNNIDEAISEELFELMAKFAAYGFNKSHSAAYGLVSYQTAYLKTFYPEEFMAAIMTCDLDNTDKIVRYIEECRRMNFKIFAPDINRSKLEFDVPEPRSVGYGLEAIKGVGGSSIQKIIEERDRGGCFQSLTDLAKRINLQKVGKKTLELLTEAGAIDSFGASRAAVMASIPEMVKFSESHHVNSSSGQVLLFADDDVEENMVDLARFEEDLVRQGRTGSQLEWLRKEKKSLGVFLSGHPMDLYADEVKTFGQLQIKDIPNKVGSKNLTLVAFLTGISERLTKNNKKMAYINLEDQTGSWEGIMFEGDLPDIYPEANGVVVVKAAVSKSYDGNSISLRVESIVPLEIVRRNLTKGIEIQISSSRKLSAQDLGQQKSTMSKIAKLLAASPGSTPVGVILKYGRVQVKIKPGQKGVELTEDLFQSLKKMDPDMVHLNCY